MKKTKLSINLGWSQQENIDYNYEKWISVCKKSDISFIRIFLCSWSINALYDDNYLNTLLKVIKQANENGIEVCLVMNNFVDYNISNYSDINDKKYSWINNPYYFKYKKVEGFFKTIDYDFLNRFKYILKKLSMCSNVKYIEIMNEIDQIECSNKILINWANNLIDELKIIFGNRYIYTCSISNHELFNEFKEKIDCYVDLHFYSFPYENAIKNIEYIRDKQAIVYLGEYAKNSDSDYLNDINSKIYFASGLWGAYFYGLDYSPLHWWWEQTLFSEDYMNIINVYNLIAKKIVYIKAIENIDVKYKFTGKTNNTFETKKIKDRIINLIKHPLFIFNEIKSIKKFINKKINKQTCVIFRKILLDNNEIYYLECSNDIVLETDFHKSNIINLLSGTKSKYNKKFSKGNYLIF